MDKVIELNELESIRNYFELSPTSEYTQKLINEIKGQEEKGGSYIFFIEMALYYIVHIGKINNVNDIFNSIFRYCVLISYLTFHNPEDPSLTSKSLDNIKYPLTVDILKSEIHDVEHSDLWGNIFNKCEYQNDFKDVQNKKNKKIFKRISNILYKQQSFFAGESPLKNLVSKERNKFVCLDDLICKMLYNDDSIKGKNSFKVVFHDEEEWKKDNKNVEHQKDVFKTLAFILKEAITQNKLTEEDGPIEVSSQSYYKTVGRMNSLTYSFISLYRYDFETNIMLPNYSEVVTPLYFSFNADEYQLDCNGIHKL